MKYKSNTIDMLTDMVTGDSKKIGLYTYYNTGPQLVEIFNRCGFSDSYSSQFPSRYSYAKERLNKLNEREEIAKFLKVFFHPSNFLEYGDKGKKILKKANEYLEFDGVKLIWRNNDVHLEKINKTNPLQIDFNIDSDEDFSKQMEKCKERMENNDFRGALTLSRTLLEHLMKLILKENGITSEEKNIKFPDLCKKIKPFLGFHSDRQFNQSLTKIFSGFQTIILAIGEARNIASDAHGTSEKNLFKIEPYQAELIFNTSTSIAKFLWEFLKTKK